MSLDELPMRASIAAKPTEKARFRWLYPAFERLPLTLDKPPSADRFNDVLRAAGRAAKDSMKVEVPFEQVAPAEADYWKGDSGKELVVPIGRAGARRLQPVRLGRGTRSICSWPARRAPVSRRSCTGSSRTRR